MHGVEKMTKKIKLDHPPRFELTTSPTTHKRIATTPLPLDHFYVCERSCVLFYLL
jgi:hypothetical protein